MDRNSPLREIKGVGAKTEELFHKIGVYTVGDILLHYPRTYIQYPQAKHVDEVLDGEQAAVLGRITRTPVVRKLRTMQITVTTISEMGASLELVWYRMPYMKNNLKVGSTYIFYGKVNKKNGRLVMEQAAMFTEEQYASMEQVFLPVYTLTNGLSNNLVTKTVRAALGDERLFMDYLPHAIREKYGLCEYNYAIRQIHFPEDMETLITARRRLVFDEFFLFILSMQYQKEKHVKEKNEFVFAEDDFTDELIEQLPYELTNAQKKALADVKRDMRSETVMQRLIQGDVGSGKTIVAFLAMADTAHNGYQSAIMAPTEVLARQHYESYQSMCEQFGLHIPIVLLTGSMTAKQKRRAYEALEVYSNAMIIGTHALIQEKAIYQNLALVITDEQHRFGVRQRETFAGKGTEPHVLVMSATPIPRTLAIIIYGDLDISVIDELPKNRLPIKNCVVDTGYRPKAYEFIRKQVAQGRQCYVICPMVEESEAMEAENVIDYCEMLSETLGDSINVSFLHGKMKEKEKDEVMNAFGRNEIQVLVSTTVVEVGIDVPNATVIMIENAERFGLAQLHQLRGRVGRGKYQSYCIFMTASKSKETKERLDILNHSNDGFFIASEDLRLRGPGDLFGIRQSGVLDFKVADVFQDAKLLQNASEEADRLLLDDPELEFPEHRKLKEHLRIKLDEIMLETTL